MRGSGEGRHSPKRVGPAVAGPGQGGHVPCPDLLQGQSKTCGPSLGRLDISGNDADEVACISGASRLASELCSGSQVCPTDPRRPPGIGPAQQEAGRRGLSQARYHKNQHGWCFGAEALPRKVFLEGSSCLGSWSLGHMGTARGWTIMSLIRVKNPRTQAACVTPAQLCPFFQPSELAEPRDTGRRATCPDSLLVGTSAGRSLVCCCRCWPEGWLPQHEASFSSSSPRLPSPWAGPGPLQAGMMVTTAAGHPGGQQPQ